VLFIGTHVGPRASAPLAVPHRENVKAHRRQIDGLDRSAEAGVRHTAENARRPMAVGRYVLVEVEQLAEDLYGLMSGALQRRRLPRRVGVGNAPTLRELERRWGFITIRQADLREDQSEEKMAAVPTRGRSRRT